MKFVICHREDYEWAKSALLDHELIHCCNVLLSPSHGMLEPALLADWMLDDKPPARFQLQLHKYVWGDEPGQ